MDLIHIHIKLAKDACENGHGSHSYSWEQLYYKSASSLLTNEKFPTMVVGHCIKNSKLKPLFLTKENVWPKDYDHTSSNIQREASYK